MVIVAIAGGTGGVGRTIVEAVVATGKHQVKVLSRKPNPSLEANLGVSVIPVDYSNVESLAKTLEDNDVHTVISTIAMFPTNGEEPREVELIRAADASKTTKRMVSSDWGLPHTPEQAEQLMTVPYKLRAQAELKKTKDLEYTVFHTGYFSDYWGMPAVKSNMTPMTAVIDIPHGVAAIPGSGNVPVVFTHTTDVAKFVAASLDLDKWDPAFFTIGDRLTWNEFVKFAEDAKGTRFKVTYDSVETLKSGHITELPSHVHAYPFFPKEALQGMLAVFGLWFEQGVFDVKPAKTLGDIFPEIKPLKVKDMLEQAWKKL